MAGLVRRTPSSISYSGTSATIDAIGSVSFDAITTLSLNDIFTSDYTNYVIYTYAAVSTNSNTAIKYRLRVSGVDATGSDYDVQYLNASSTSVSAGRGSDSGANVCPISVDNESASILLVYGPALATKTASRTLSAQGTSGAQFNEHVNMHTLTTAYDGFTVYPAAGNVTGTIHIFAFEE